MPPLAGKQPHCPWLQTAKAKTSKKVLRQASFQCYFRAVGVFLADPKLFVLRLQVECAADPWQSHGATAERIIANKMATTWSTDSTLSFSGKPTVEMTPHTKKSSINLVLLFCWIGKRFAVNRPFKSTSLHSANNLCQPRKLSPPRHPHPMESKVLSSTLPQLQSSIPAQYPPIAEPSSRLLCHVCRTHQLHAPILSKKNILQCRPQSLHHHSPDWPGRASTRVTFATKDFCKCWGSLSCKALSSYFISATLFSQPLNTAALCARSWCCGHSRFALIAWSTSIEVLTKWPRGCPTNRAASRNSVGVLGTPTMTTS